MAEASFGVSALSCGMPSPIHQSLSSAYAAAAKGLVAEASAAAAMALITFLRVQSVFIVKLLLEKFLFDAEVERAARSEMHASYFARSFETVGFGLAFCHTAFEPVHSRKSLTASARSLTISSVGWQWRSTPLHGMWRWV